MAKDFKHEVFEQWRRERHKLVSPIGAPSMAPWVTLDLDQTVEMFLADVPEARKHTAALTEYLRTRYPHGIHVRSNASASASR